MHSDVFSVIADPTRRRIVRILAEQTHTVGAVVEKLGMSQPTISKHLKVLRDADVVSVTVEGQRRLYSLNPDVFATVTEWINETVQIARQSNEAHAPVALPGGVTASASDKTAAEKPVEKTSEKSAPKPEATDSETLTVEAPTSEEIEQARIQRARAQHLTPSARIYSRPAEQVADSAASEPVAEKAGAAEPISQEETVDSTPMRPFTPASYGYDAGVTPAASASPAQPATPAAPAEVKPAETTKTTEAKPVVAHKPVVFPQPAAVVSYGTDPAAVVGGSIQPIAVIPEAVALEKAADEKVAVEKPVAPAESVTEEATGKDFAAEESASEDSAAEKSVIEKNVVDEASAEEPVKADSAEEAASPAEATEKDELAKGEPANDELTKDEPVEGEPAKAETSAEEPEYQTMPSYDSVYRPSTETNSAEAKDNHRGGLFGFLRGRRR
ncbi:metalloregulator ArsR/SmtB family transcription factor [Rothia sp. HMSC061D12]|uniref:ArsR/SmtB family transcription factor n=1 Tax=Rothia sp. HMSC061D12 TaxID=1715161 RepID=UPI0008A98B4F|nr:metalloregulator ArsR/SmtB family transcription factor [Rothia sp. HMSC061D12]OHP56379.1 transcriptional regulator [Rothia sp. HMSC061D12]